LTTALVGCGGQIKSEPEDFWVEEIPAYLPCGEGEHLFLWLEKRGVSTPEIAQSLARSLGLSEREVSYGGLKDRQGVTAQFFCVPARAESALTTLKLPHAKIHYWKRHSNKLRSGHLAGNRFRIRIRGADPQAASEVLEQLRHTGVPNYFGPQRFGARGDNPEIGKRLLQGQERLRLNRFQRRLFLSAYQSLLFNRALSARIAAGTFQRALAGDVMRKAAVPSGSVLPSSQPSPRGRGGLFVCTEPAVDQPRLERFEISPTGPIFGPKMMPAAGAVAAEEDRLLRQESLTLEDFQRGGDETEGGRRMYRIPLAAPELSHEGQDVWLAFELPKGSYATIVLHEVMGAQVAAAANFTGLDTI
jgi:tRNA pseudouridine13 synthase